MTVFDCQECGQQIGSHDSHVLLTDSRLVCMRHYVEHLDAGQVRTVLTRDQASFRLQPGWRPRDRRQAP